VKFKTAIFKIKVLYWKWFFFAEILFFTRGTSGFSGTPFWKIWFVAQLGTLKYVLQHTTYFAPLLQLPSYVFYSQLHYMHEDSVARICIYSFNISIVPYWRPTLRNYWKSQVKYKKKRCEKYYNAIEKYLYAIFWECVNCTRYEEELQFSLHCHRRNYLKVCDEIYFWYDNLILVGT
jgi:hypothetical protein